MAVPPARARMPRSRPRAKLEKLAAVLKAEGWRSNVILASPLTRAVQTVHMLAAGIGVRLSPVVVRARVRAAGRALERLEAVQLQQSCST